MATNLTGGHQDTYDMIFRHPIAHNLEWRSLISVFKQIGEIEEEQNGKLKFTRNGRDLTLMVKGKDVDVEDIMTIRHFLSASDDDASSANGGAKDLIVILDHQGAHIHDAVSDRFEPIHIEPEDPSGHDQHVHNPKGDSGGKQGPTRKLFYEKIAKELTSSDHILLIGDGHGASSEVEHFVSNLLTHHHANLEKRIIGKEVLDLHHLSESELLKKAREIFIESLSKFSTN